MISRKDFKVSKSCSKDKGVYLIARLKKKVVVRANSIHELEEKINAIIFPKNDEEKVEKRTEVVALKSKKTTKFKKGKHSWNK